MAITDNDLAGFWSIVHDDWHGTLELKKTGVGSSGHSTGPNGSCTYYSTLLAGTWTGSSGNAHSVSQFYLGGADHRNRRRNELCASTGHLVRFDIEFDPRDPQNFEGYVFTHSKSIMAGYTWWSGIPFGWYAIKRD